MKLCRSLFAWVAVSATAFGQTSTSALNPQPSQALVESFGIDVHTSNSKVVDKNAALLLQELQRLGAKHIRASTEDPNQNGHFAAFGAQMQQISNLTGAKFNILLSTHSPNQTATAANIEAIANNFGIQNIDAFEGNNEKDYGMWVDNYLADTQAIAAAVRANSDTKNIPIWAGALHDWKNAELLPDISAYVDACTDHPYPASSFLNPDTAVMAQEPTGFVNSCPGKPVVSTETGYYTFVPGHPKAHWMDEDVEAKYMPRSVMNSFLIGSKRTEVYELFDIPETTINSTTQAHYGLIAATGTVDNPTIREKPAFTALANTLALFQDSGSVTPVSFPITITGQSSATRELLFQKSNGHYLLVVWEAVLSYDAPNNVVINNPAANITITLPTTANVTLFQPSTQASAITEYQNVSSLNTASVDQISVFDIAPVSAVTSTPAIPPVIALTSGTYTLTNVASTLVLDDPASTTVSGKQMIQWNSHNGANQHWVFTSNGAGYYTIQNVASGLYLTDAGGSTTAGTALVQQAATNDASQLWSLKASGGAYNLVNKASGLAVDDPRSSTAQGTGMILWTVNGGANQKWNIH